MAPHNAAYLPLNVQDAASGRLLPARRRRSQANHEIMFVRHLFQALPSFETASLAHRARFKPFAFEANSFQQAF
jgi:hypothetical protein